MQDSPPGGHIAACFKPNVSNEKNPGDLLYFGWIILSRYTGIIVSHEIRIPSLNNQHFMKSKFFFSWLP